LTESVTFSNVSRKFEAEDSQNWVCSAIILQCLCQCWHLCIDSH